MKAVYAININIIPTYFNVASIPAPPSFIQESQSAFQMLINFLSRVQGHTYYYHPHFRKESFRVHFTLRLGQNQVIW